MTLRALAVTACLSSVCFAQNLSVVPVPWEPLDPNIAHQAYNGHATTFKAIARGGNGTYLYEWDFNGDGVYDFSASTTNRYNLSARFFYPNQAQDITFTARVRVTSNGQLVIASYPVQVFADVPMNPANATNRQQQVMRNVAIDDGLWFLHNQMSRSGNETDPLVGAQITGNLGSSWGGPTLLAGLAVESLGRNRHFPAFPAAYLGELPNALENSTRWNVDPYAEDAARLVNFLMTQMTIVTVSPQDESNLTGFYPELTASPIPGTDDGIGIFVGATPGALDVGVHANVLRGLALSRLTGFVAQTGDANRALGRKFEFIIQQMVDGLVWAQNDAGAVGSWYYTPNANADMLGELTAGALDASESLWQVEQSMRSSGVLVPNLVKARLIDYLRTNLTACAQGGTGGHFTNGNTGSACEFSTTAAHLFSYGWVGGNAFAVGDARLAFPSYSGLTRAQVRGWYDSTLTFMSNVFRSTSVGAFNWDIGLVAAGDFGRADGQGNHWGMVHWARAARASEPEIANFGPGNDWLRLFTQYLVNQQRPQGDFNWTYGGLQQNHDNGTGPTHRAAWSLLTLSPDALVPVASASVSATTAPEGTPLTFTANSTELGTFSWNLGNGDTRAGAQLTYAFPDNGSFNVSVTQTLPGGSTTTENMAVTITNAPPVVDAGAALTLDEGATASFVGSASDPGTADTLTFGWTFGDSSSANTAVASHAFADDGTFTATFTATDDDGAAASATRVVTVRNVAPTITSVNPTSATEGTAVSYTLTFTDPGTADTHTCSAPTKASNATLTGCTLSWTPSGAQTTAPAHFRLCVTDDDGSQACQDFDVAVAVLDIDGDSLPDSWERSFFGNLSQGAAGDPDVDGLTNREEFLGSTNPVLFDGPSAPSLSLPVCNAVTPDARPSLTVTNATDPQGTALRYEFELYDDAALASLVIVALDVPAGASTTTWRVPVPLQEDGHYWWRARARDEHTAGAWTMPACAFVVNAVNALPSAPRLDSPAFGARVTSLQPTLVVGNAIDPENDALAYEFEVFAGTTRVATQTGIAAGNGTTSWQVSPALQEDATYSWRARAMSAGGAGPWSEPGQFGINTGNAEPTAPVLLSPQNGTLVSTLTPTLAFQPGTDADGDEVTVELEVAADETFANPVASAMGLTQSRFALTTALEEDVRHCWRARSSDGQSTSAWVQACFGVSAEDGAPNVPTLSNPSSDSVVATTTPVFSWATAVDPEGASVFYELELRQGDALVTTLEGLSGNTALVPQALVSGAHYTWRVRAVTRDGGPASAFSAGSAFDVLVPEPAKPATGCGCSGSPEWGGMLLVLAALSLRRRRS